MKTSTFVKLGAFSSMVFVAVVSAGCVAGGSGEESQSEVAQGANAESAESSPASAAPANQALPAGRALLSAFPTFNREKPIAVDVDLDEEAPDDADLVETTPETRETVGIDHWSITSNGVDGFIDGARVLAFRFAADTSADDGDTPPPEVSVWWAFNGESGVHTASGFSSTTSLSEQGKAVLALLAHDLQQLEGTTNALSFKCLGAKAGLALAVATAVTSCAASIAELGANPAADIVCLGTLVAVGSSVKSVYNACGVVPTIGVKPIGPYYFSCKSIKMDFINNKLTASCPNSQKKYITSTLTNPLQCLKLIRNCNGTLKCTIKC